MIRFAISSDVAAAADLAAAKRMEYEDYSPRFWCQAIDAREKLAPFLDFCVNSENYTSLVDVEGSDILGFLVASHHVPIPPFAQELSSAWLIDDFLLASAFTWTREGTLLLDRISHEARKHAVERLVVVTARRDRPKASFLTVKGYVLTTSWWIREVEPQ